MADEEKDEVVTLHPDHKSVFVNGIGGSLTKSEGQAKNISMYIYNHGPHDTARVDLVHSKASHPKTVCSEAKQMLEGHLRQCVLGIEEEDENVEQVRLVIYAHSNGCKVVDDVLKPEAITSLLKDKMGIHELEIEKKEKRLRKGVAVITFGGVSYIPDSHAKLVLNFSYGTDYYSRVCHFLGIGEQYREGTYIRDPNDPKEKKSPYTGLLQSIRNTFSAGSHISFPSSSKNTHGLNNYFNTSEKRMINYIRHCLGIDDPPYSISNLEKFLGSSEVFLHFTAEVITFMHNLGR